MPLLKYDHPQGDPNLPSFVHPALADVLEDLERAGDLWKRLKGAAEKYLPKEQKEPKPAYQARLERATFTSFFREGIVAFAGSLSRFECRDAPKSFMDNLANIDGAGTSLKAFMMVADAWVLRDSGCLLTVDLPKEVPSNRAEEVQMARRPHLAQVQRRHVLNWEEEEVGGIPTCVACTIMEWVQVKEGLYGTKYEPRYREMRGGNWRLLRMDRQDNGPATWKVEEEDKGTFTDVRGKALDYPPVVWYGATPEGFGRGELPMASLGDLNLAHFREWSDKAEQLHRTVLITPWREGAAPGSPGMVLGPHGGIEVPTGGKVGLLEPSGSSQDYHQKQLEHIENLIDRQTLAFLSNGAAQKTATQSILESAQLQATLTTLAEAKGSAMESIYRIWARFTGETAVEGAGIDMAPGIADQTITPETLTLADKLYNSGLISRETVVSLQHRANLLGPGRTVEDELEAIKKEEPDPADTPDPNDPVSVDFVPARPVVRDPMPAAA